MRWEGEGEGRETEGEKGRNRDGRGRSGLPDSSRSSSAIPSRRTSLRILTLRKEHNLSTLKGAGKSLPAALSLPHLPPQPKSK